MSDLKETSLTNVHIELGAKMAPFAGFNMPLQYTSVKEESKAVRENCGVFDVSHMGEFFVTGPEAVKFVDYLVPNDFAGAAIGKAVYSPLCRQNGTMVDDLIAYKLETEKVLICVNASNIQKDWDWISQFSKDFDCQLTNRSDDYSLLAIQGPKSEEVLSKLNMMPEGEFGYYSAKEFENAKGTFILARTGYTGEDGFEVFGGHNEIMALWSELLKQEVTPCGLASRDVLRLEVAYPLYGHELNDDLTPLDTGLKWTVRLNTSNFVGKEFLSSFTPTKRLVKLSLDKGIPREGYDILNSQGEKIGVITSGTMSVATNKGIGIGLVEVEKFPQDKKFKIQVRSNQVEANYHTKAFVSGGHK